jgi:prophage regulatory protein
MAERMGMPPGSVLGTADVARRLGVTRQRVSQLRKDPTFPRTGIGYGRVGLWHRAGMECWAAAHRPGRPEAGGRFAGEAGALLLAVERAAQRLGLHWIDSGLFWLVVADGEAGPALRGAVESMGITSVDIEIELHRMRGTDERPRRSCRMNPHMQSFLASADGLAERDRRKRIRAIDILLAFIDAKPQKDHRGRLRPSDHLLDMFERRGLDIAELRRRLVAANAEPASIAGFEPRRLRPWRSRLRKRPAWLDLAPNPLGHDPWTRRPWGTVFARTRDERGLKVDGEQWFFSIDGDGFFVRAADGRPVGYRYRLEPKPRRKPTNGFMEILPMPPTDLADWPDRRFGGDD